VDIQGLLHQLLEGRHLSLGSWFAAPIPPDQAQALLPGVRQSAGAPADGRATVPVRLAELILRFWSGHDVEPDYGNCLALCADDRERAMLELCYGQLMIARRIEGAWTHLDRGFALAARLLEAEEYFAVLKRHELLRELALGPVPLEGLPLDTLCAEARVITRLRGGPRTPRPKQGRHRDTLD
jgi:hypothetical protein